MLSVLLIFAFVVAPMTLGANALDEPCEHNFRSFLYTKVEPSCYGVMCNVYNCGECGEDFEITTELPYHIQTEVLEIIEYPSDKGRGLVKLYCEKCDVTCTEKTNVCLVPDESKQVIELNYRETRGISPEIHKYADSAYILDFDSDNSDVADVNMVGYNKTGYVKANGIGTTTIHAKLWDIETNTVYTDSYEVKVTYTWWQWIIKIVFFGWIWY